MKCDERYKSAAIKSRPPRGGRGLKSLVFYTRKSEIVVAPLAGGVD